MQDRGRSDERINLLNLRIVCHANPLLSNCDDDDIIANGQYGDIWPMRCTQQGGERIIIFVQNV